MALLAPQPAEFEPAEPRCHVCGEPADAARPLVRGGCACRGGAGVGAAHLACLVDAARADAELWLECRCEQYLTGEAALGLSQARLDLAEAETAQSDAVDAERIDAQTQMVLALAASGDYIDSSRAVKLGRETLVAARRLALEPERRALLAKHALAVAYAAIGDHASVLAQRTEALAGWRSLRGQMHDETVRAMEHVARAHAEARRPDAALPILAKAVAFRSAGGVGDAAALAACRMDLANMHMELADHDTALPLFVLALEAREGELGSSHPHTLLAMVQLGTCISRMGAQDAAAGLLETGASGLKALFGTNHPWSALAKGQLEMNRRAIAVDCDVVVAKRSPIPRRRRTQFSPGAPVMAQLCHVRSLPALNGTDVSVQSISNETGKYTVLQTTADNALAKMYLGADKLNFTPGTGVLVTSRDSELFGRKGHVQSSKDGQFTVEFQCRSEPAKLPFDDVRAFAIVTDKEGVDSNTILSHWHGLTTAAASAEALADRVDLMLDAWEVEEESLK